MNLYSLRTNHNIDDRCKKRLLTLAQKEPPREKVVEQVNSQVNRLNRQNVLEAQYLPTLTRRTKVFYKDRRNVKVCDALVLVERCIISWIRWSDRHGRCEDKIIGVSFSHSELVYFRSCSETAAKEVKNRAFQYWVVCCCWECFWICLCWL